MPETTTMPEVLTLEDAAHFLKLAPDAVARQAEAGQIPGRQVEGSWRFLLSRLEDWRWTSLSPRSTKLGDVPKWSEVFECISWIRRGQGESGVWGESVGSAETASAQRSSPAPTGRC